jgi:hypothetical protein
MYQHYKNTQKEKGKEPVSLSKYRRILKEHNQFIVDEIIENSGEYRLPYRLGYLRIKKCKQKLKLDHDGKLITRHMHVDWAATKELWKNNEEAAELKKVIFHTNRDTQGYYFKWYWDKRVSNIRNHSVYSLVMTRTNKRKIAQALKNNENLDYYE